MMATNLMKIFRLYYYAINQKTYNTDETGLFFRALPAKALILKYEKCVGGKHSKETATLLHCASMSGDKEKLLVIGKSARPRAFRGVPFRHSYQYNLWFVKFY